MTEWKYKTVSELIEKTQMIIGEKIGKYDVDNLLSSNSAKGNIGNIIEVGFYGIGINVKQVPDFENLGIELKVTGYKWTHQNRLVSAKERLVLSMINYFEDIKSDFYDSNLYHKIDKILFLLYEFRYDIPPSDFSISRYFLYEFQNIDEKDREIIIDDWNSIISKIKEGKAHEISEGDTFYLGACTKSSDSSKLTRQPFSDYMAKPRAYSLKTSYMTNLLRNNFGNYESRESFIKDLNALKTKSFREIVIGTFDQFKGKTLTEIDKIIKLPVNRKDNRSYISNYISRMMNVSDNKLYKLDEFLKANIKIKSIRVTKKGKIKESMSFPAMDFCEVAKETWEESSLKNLFETTKFLFVIFDEVDDDRYEYRLRGVGFWNMPETDIENHLKKVWDSMNHVLNSRVVLEVKNGYITNNFPKTKDNLVAHVRPHGINSNDTIRLPNKCVVEVSKNDFTRDVEHYLSTHCFTKQCFWLNSKYIVKVLTELNV